MVAAGGGSNGHWVRTRHPEGLKSFMAEQQMDADRRHAARLRSRARRRAVLRWVRARWRQLARR